jgi:branched-chain amino acid transport system substrate-binding protein
MRRLLAVAIAGVVALVPGCTTGEPEAPRPSSVVLGEVDPLTGPLAARGFHNGILLAVEQANQAGGIRGRQIRLLVRDNQSRPDLAASAAQGLVTREHAVALVGGFVDSLVAPVASVANSRRVPFVAAASLAKELTSSGNRYFFRVSSLDPFTTSTVGFVRSRRAAKVGIIYSSTPGSTQLAQDQRAALEDAGLVVSPFQSVTVGTQDFSPLLARVKGASPDALLVNDPSEGDAILMAKQLRALGVRLPIVLFSFGLEPSTLAAMGPVADGLYATVAWEAGLPVGGEPGASLGQAYRQRFGEVADEGVAHGYAAAAALIQAMRALGSTQITSQQLVGALRAVSVDTPLGTVRFTSTGDPSAYRRYVVRVQERAYTLVFRPTE